MLNKTKAEKEKRIVRFAVQNPSFSIHRLANELKKDGISISAGVLYNILKPHGLIRRYDCLFALE